MRNFITRHSDGLPPSARATSSSRAGPRKRLREAFLLSCILAGLAGCAGFKPSDPNPAFYELLDKDGPTGLKVTGFIPGCTSGCLNEIVRKEASWAASAPAVAGGPNQPPPRRWLVIHVDQRSIPHPVAQLTGRMIGPGDSHKISNASAPAYGSAPSIVFKHSMSAFASRFFGSVG
jgi:hypothetical protein